MTYEANRGSAQPRIKVGMHEYGYAASGTEIYTLGLGPCIAVLVYDPLTSDARLAHIVDMNDDSPALQKILTDATAHTSNPQDLQIFVRGGGWNIHLRVDSPSYIKSIQQNRRGVQEMLATFGLLPQSDIQWTESPGNESAPVHTYVDMGLSDKGLTIATNHAAGMGAPMVCYNEVFIPSDNGMLVRPMDEQL
jgi:hypothetical protein